MEGHLRELSEHSLQQEIQGHREDRVGVIKVDQMV